MADDPTYHIHIWDSPPTYVCQICNVQGLTKDAVISHLDTEHQVPPIPTLLAADYERGEPTLREMIMPPSPTYYTTQEDATTIYHCLICQQQGQEHHATDRDLFEQHQHQRHAGDMIAGEAPAAREGEGRAAEDEAPVPAEAEQPPPEAEQPLPEAASSPETSL